MDMGTFCTIENLFRFIGVVSAHLPIRSAYLNGINNK